ncbi:MAG: hypothetical protein NWE83_14500 [Candidatus Bathyarchaeota archaeon]|nr:hypothetical protein [Candidatus Bathyarchaeota archaeon]
MNTEISNELGKMRAWLHEALMRNEVDKQKLTAFLEIINGSLEITPPIESESTSGITVAEVMRVFEDDQLEVLEFSQEENVIVIRRKQYLERDMWLAINAKVDEVGGRWTSAGEDSRWEIPNPI